MEARGEARQQVKQETGQRFILPFTDASRRKKELVEEIKARKIQEALTTKELTTQKKHKIKLKRKCNAAKMKLL
ncbi:MAG: hypothetical protein CM15mV65_120 [Caudoviricetes sp.]|nr:MAG: hypothetical protein CM15mV65_120 [Caudoviricetes sp.]